MLAGVVGRPTRAGTMNCWIGWGMGCTGQCAPRAVLTRHRFLTRSRLLGAMSAATVVVAAGARSGALRVATEAHPLGRQVGAAPGPVISASSHGPHMRPRTGHAHLVTSAAAVEELTTDRTAQHPDLSAKFTRHEAPMVTPPDRSL